MKLSKKSTGGAIVGLDLGAGSIAATELSGGAGATKIDRAAVGPLEPGAFAEGEVVAPEQLSDALRDFFAEHKLNKRVRIGIANQKVAVRTVRLPLVEDPEELEAAVRFKAQDEIPMPLDQAVLDHRIVAHSKDGDGRRQVDVIVVAARRDMIEVFLDTMRRAGLRPVGIDLAAFGMIRALVDRRPVIEESGEQREVPTTLYCSVGDGTNLAFARGRSCLFTRVSPFGSEEIAAELAESSGLTLAHARQWLGFVGLDRPLDQIEGGEGSEALVASVRDAVEQGSTRLLDEIRLSLDFYGHLPDVPPVDELVVTGQGAAIPGLAAGLGEGLGLSLREALPPALDDREPEAGTRLVTSYGLALEE